MHSALSHLTPESLHVLETSVRPKFNAYFAFTRPLTRDVPGTSGYVYPDDSVMSDLTVLASLFGEVDQAFNEHRRRPDLAAALAGNADLREDYRQIVEVHSGQAACGSFWVTGPNGLERVSADDTVRLHFETLLRTLRNGFAHFHWRYDNLSALDYWNAQNWSTQGAPASFDLLNRPANNYMAYIADGQSWNSRPFWNLQDLRVLATPIPCLRYHLHLSLQQILNNRRVDIFGNRL